MSAPTIIVLIFLGIYAPCLLLHGLPERSKIWLERRWRRWWLRRTKRDRRPKPKKLRIVMDPSAGYRGGIPRVEEVDDDRAREQA